MDLCNFKDEFLKNIEDLLEKHHQKLEEEISEIVNHASSPGSMEANNTHSSIKGGSFVLPPKTTHLDPPKTNKSGVSKKSRTFIYATPSPTVGMRKPSLNRGSLTEPHNFGSKRKISYTNITDARLLDDNINEERDLRLLNYIFDEKLPKSEILASIDDCQCTRKIFDTLKPTQFVDDLVINTYIAMVEYDERRLFRFTAPRNWFLPTTFERLLNAHPNWDAEAIYKKFLSKDRHGASDLNKNLKIFIVLNWDDIHWFLCVIDFNVARVDIIDSLSGVNPDDRLTQVEPLVERIHGALNFGFGKSYVRSIMTFSRKMMTDVAKQQNHHDCGLFTMLYTRAYSQARFDLLSNLPSSETLRNVIAVQMVKHDGNVVKDSILNHV